MQTFISIWMTTFTIWRIHLTPTDKFWYNFRKFDFSRYKNQLSRFRYPEITNYYFHAPHFCESDYSDIIVGFDRCSYPFLLPAPPEIQIHAGERRQHAATAAVRFVAYQFRYRMATVLQSVGHKIPGLIADSGLLCAARTRVPSRSGRQSVRERTYRRAYERRFMRAIVRPAEGRRTAVNVAPFTFP